MDEITQPGRPMPPAAVVPPAPSGAPPGPGKREPRSLPAGQGAAWWSEGWQVFMAAPGTWIGLIVVFILLMFVMAFVPVFGSVAGMVLTPVFGGGIALGCHALAKGRPLTIGHLFEGFSGGRFMPLFIVGLICVAPLYLAYSLLVIAVLVVLGFADGAGLFSALSPDASQMGGALMSPIGGVALVVVPIALVAVAALTMAYWFAAPLIVLNGEEPIAAMKKSFRACWQNMGATLVYGLIGIGLAIVASIPLALGWFLLAPVMWGSSYASWRETFDA